MIGGIGIGFFISYVKESNEEITVRYYTVIYLTAVFDRIFVA